MQMYYHDSMLDKIRAKVGEFESMRKKLENPAVYGDPEELKAATRQVRALYPLVKAWQEYERLGRTIAEAEEWKADPELKHMAEEEAVQARGRLPMLEAEMKRLLIPKNPDDERSVILEVRAGTGGEEAALFAAEQLKMYLKYAEARGWKTELIDKADADAGGVKEVSARIEGEGAYGELKFESGVHRVQRIPATENRGRVHTSTTTVAILPEAEEVDLTIRNEDLRIDTYRASGAGGQHVNKTDSAVRMTHLPTHTVVACQTERSQQKNRVLAMKILRSRLYAAQQEKLARERGDMRSSQIGSADRSEKIRTYNFPQDRITDHRLKENFSNIPGVMEGKLGGIVEALRKWEEGEALKKM